MKSKSITSLLGTAILVAANVATPARADAISKADNSNALYLGTSWVGGNAPGASDVATWSTALAAGSRTTALGADVEWLGMAVPVTPGSTLTLSSGNILTLGAGGITCVPDITLNVNCAVKLSADQTWSLTTGYFNVGDINTQGNQLTVMGSSSKKFGAITGGGPILVRTGTLTFNTGSGPRAETSPITVRPGATLNYDLHTGSKLLADSVTLIGGTLITKGDSASSALDTITQSLTTDRGAATVTLTPHSSRSLRLTSGSLVRTNSGTVLFRGPGLGSNTVAALAANSANVVFTNAPALVGASLVAGSTTNSILVGAYGDTAVAGTGLGLVTYDGTYGIRLLDTANEYAATIADGQTQLDNVRLANTSGAGVQTTTLASPTTTINSLSINETGIGTNTGITVTGNAGTTLKLNSGTVFAYQAVTTPAASDVMLLSVPTLDLNGQEGVFIVSTRGVSNGSGVAPLSLRSVVANDGGKGITFGGSGLTYIEGSVISTYTGPTTVNSGAIRIMKTGTDIGIPGNLVVNGGTAQNPGNQIPNTSDIFINGGTYAQRGQALDSQVGASETYRDLYMTGGTYVDGVGGTSSGTTTMRSGMLSGGGTWQVNGAHKTTLSGSLSIANGGVVAINRAYDTTRTTVMTVNGNVYLTNTLSGAFSPITTAGGGSAGINGSRLVLGGDVAFTGNSGNTNTVTVTATAPTSGGGYAMIALNGTRTFDIGDGAAGVDLQLAPVLTNNNAVVGALVKTGAGTLALNATNAYSGGTAVNVGTLAGTGSLASDLTVGATGAVAPGTPGTVGTFTVNANVAFANGSVLKIDASGANADLLAVTGAVTGSGTVSVTPTVSGTGPWLVMTADSITPSFVSSDSDWYLSKRNGGTELWLLLDRKTVILIR